MPNTWVSFVKEFADKKKIKYNDAMKSSECKDAYQKTKVSLDMTKDVIKMSAKTKKPKESESKNAVLAKGDIVEKPMEAPAMPRKQAKKSSTQ